jgi:hypothetical protein
MNLEHLYHNRDSLSKQTEFPLVILWKTRKNLSSAHKMRHFVKNRPKRLTANPVYRL